MTDMIEVKTADLIGSALDWAVAVATGYPMPDILRYLSPVTHDTRDPELWCPSVSWAHGGPLIEKHMLRVKPHVSSNGVITSWAADMTWPCDTMPGRCGKTPLIAACRAIVMKELGAVVSVPKELMP